MLVFLQRTTYTVQSIPTSIYIYSHMQYISIHCVHAIYTTTYEMVKIGDSIVIIWKSFIIALVGIKHVS